MCFLFLILIKTQKRKDVNLQNYYETGLQFLVFFFEVNALPIAINPPVAVSDVPELHF